MFNNFENESRGKSLQDRRQEGTSPPHKKPKIDVTSSSATKAGVEDDLWGEELDDNTVEECFFLASQAFSQKNADDTPRTKERSIPSSSQFKKPTIQWPQPQPPRPKYASLLFTKDVTSTPRKAEINLKKSATFPMYTNEYPRNISSTSRQTIPRSVNPALQSSSKIIRTIPKNIPSAARKGVQRNVFTSSSRSSETSVENSSKKGPTSSNTNIDAVFSQDGRDSLLREIQQLKMANQKLEDQVHTKEGEVSILRTQLNSSKAEIETQRLSKMQEFEKQSLEYREKIKDLKKELEQTKTKLEFKHLEVGNAQERCRLLESQSKVKLVEPQPSPSRTFPKNAVIPVLRSSTASSASQPHFQHKAVIHEIEISEGSLLANLVIPALFEKPAGHEGIGSFEYSRQVVILTPEYGNNLSPHGMTVNVTHTAISKLVLMKSLEGWHAQRLIDEVVWQCYLLFDKQLNLLHLHKPMTDEDKVREHDIKMACAAGKLLKGDANNVMGARQWYRCEQGVEVRRALGLLGALASVSRYAAEHMSGIIDLKKIKKQEGFLKKRAVFIKKPHSDSEIGSDKIQSETCNKKSENEDKSIHDNREQMSRSQVTSQNKTPLNRSALRNRKPVNRKQLETCNSKSVGGNQLTFFRRKLLSNRQSTPKIQNSVQKMIPCNYRGLQLSNMSSARNLQKMKQVKMRILTNLAIIKARESIRRAKREKAKQEAEKEFAELDKNIENLKRNNSGDAGPYGLPSILELYKNYLEKGRIAKEEQKLKNKKQSALRISQYMTIYASKSCTERNKQDEKYNPPEKMFQLAVNNDDPLPGPSNQFHSARSVASSSLRNIEPRTEEMNSIGQQANHKNDDDHLFKKPFPVKQKVTKLKTLGKSNIKKDVGFRERKRRMKKKTSCLLDYHQQEVMSNQEVLTARIAAVLKKTLRNKERNARKNEKKNCLKNKKYILCKKGVLEAQVPRKTEGVPTMQSEILMKKTAVKKKTGVMKKNEKFLRKGERDPKEKEEDLTKGERCMKEKEETVKKKDVLRKTPTSKMTDLFEVLYDIVHCICDHRLSEKFNGVLFGVTYLLRTISYKVNIGEKRHAVLTNIVKDLILCRPSINVLIELTDLLFTLGRHCSIMQALCTGAGPSPYLAGNIGMVHFVKGKPRYDMGYTDDIYYFKRKSCVLSLLCWLALLQRADIEHYVMLGNNVIKWFGCVSSHQKMGPNWIGVIDSTEDVSECQCRARIIEAAVMLLHIGYRHINDNNYKKDTIFYEIQRLLGRGLVFLNRLVHQDADVGLLLANAEGEYQIMIYGLMDVKETMEFNEEQKEALKELKELEDQQVANYPVVKYNDKAREMIRRINETILSFCSPMYW